MDGFLVVDKPVGVTSHDMVSLVRKLFKMKKVGHTGTLDPFATGVLPIALGEGTKAIPFLDEAVKEYRAIMKLGETTDTGDCTGRVITSGEWQHLDAAAVEKVVALFIGRIHQIPPMFSALKRNGVPLYKLARRGETVERDPRPVTIYSLIIESVMMPEVAFTVRCSRGTYVRTLATDMGEKLGCGAHLVSLRRTASGPFTLDQAVSPEDLALMVADGRSDGLLLSPYEALGHLKDLPLSDAGVARVSCGVIPGAAEILAEGATAVAPGERVRLSCRGRLVAVAENSGDKCSAVGEGLHLVRVFN